MLLPARLCLIAQHSVVAEHPDDHRSLRQHIYLGGSTGLIGGRVFHHGRTDMPRAIRIVHRATGQPEHRDQRGGG